MDKLETLFAEQAAFNASINKTRHLEDVTDDEWVQKFALALIVEAGELLDAAHFQWWKNPRPIDREHLKEEAVDVFHFAVSVALAAGMDARELFERYQSQEPGEHRPPAGPVQQARVRCTRIGAIKQAPPSADGGAPVQERGRLRKRRAAPFPTPISFAACGWQYPLPRRGRWPRRRRAGSRRWRRSRRASSKASAPPRPAAGWGR